MQRCLEGGAVVFVVGDGFDEGEHFVGGLGADKRRHRVLAHGETDGELAEAGEDFGAGFRGLVGTLFF